MSSEEAIRGYKTSSVWHRQQRRLAELDRLFIRIYEDNVSGRITDERFSMMSRTYEDEQTQLKVEIQSLQQEIEVQERQIENLEQFIQRVHKYEDLQELTPYALRELVKAIYIEAPDKSSGKRRQNIRISYDLVGFIPLNELDERGNGMTEAMPFLQKTILLSYDPRPFAAGSLFYCLYFFQPFPCPQSQRQLGEVRHV